MKNRKLFKLAAMLAAWAFAHQSAVAQLDLQVNRQTGAVNLVNNSGGAIDIDSLGITSVSGLLNPGGWTSFADGLPADWQEVDDLSNFQIGELSPQSSSLLADGSSTSLGLAVASDRSTAEANAGFGVDVEDLVFEYGITGTSQTAQVGTVTYLGEERFNDLVLLVDVTTGNVKLKNDSSLPFDIDEIEITSATGQLNAAWNGLRDDSLGFVGGAGGSDSVNGLSEFNPTGESTIPAGATFDLGTAFQLSISPAARDLEFGYSFEAAGVDETFSGFVRYLDADFDANGLVSGADFLTWQRGFGLNEQTDNSNGDANGRSGVSGDDLAVWEAQYGSTVSSLAAASISAVPEPTSAVLVLFGIGVLTASSRKGNR